MFFASCLRSLRAAFAAPADHRAGRPPQRRPPHRVLLRLELLEDRTVPSTLTVTNTRDSGAGSLREAIQNAAPGDTVVIQATGTIRLQSTLGIGQDLTILGPGSDQLTVSGQNTAFVTDFSLAPDINVTLSGLTIADGNGTSGPDSRGGGPGGGILAYDYNGDVLTVSNCTFSGNLAGAGGAIYSGTGNTLTVSNCRFSGNSAIGISGLSFGGGAIYNDGTLVVNNSIFADNLSPNATGGAIDSRPGNGSTLTVSNSTFTGNSSGSGGGGIYSTFAQLTVSNSTFTGNSAGYGGGIAFRDAVNIPYETISNCTIVGNTAYWGVGYGAGIMGGLPGSGFGGLLQMTDTIVALNQGGPDVEVSLSSHPISLGHNLIGNADGTTGWVASDLTGTTAQPLDPLVGPLQDNGGPTPTMALLFGSPAIDAGDNANGGLPVPDTDQRGQARISNGTVDIGAFEVQHFALQDAVAAVWSGTSGTPEIDVSVTPDNIDSYLAAVANLTPNPAASQPVPIVFDLGGNTISGQTVSVPDGVTLTFQNGTFIGHSPALTVTSGAVVVRHSVLTNATDAPTIRLAGGNLTLRNDTVQESTGYNQVAILVEGGSLDLGTPSDPGGNTINVNGSGELLLNPDGYPVTMYGDTWQVNGTALVGGIVRPGEAAGIGFWHGPDGRALINALGTDRKGVSLAGTWLAAAYPNLYGSLSKSTPDGVWNYFVSLFNSTGVKLEAQVMATALSVLVTDTTLNTTNLGRATALKYGFTGGGALAAEYAYADADQAADLGLTGGAGYYTVGRLLAAANAKASRGLLFAQAADSLRGTLNDLFDSINESGDVATP